MSQSRLYYVKYLPNIVVLTGNKKTNIVLIARRFVKEQLLGFGDWT